MWSLPDIRRMNENAAKFRKTLETIVSTGKKQDGSALECDNADDHCTGEVTGEAYYDIFSDDPKGIVAQCEYHEGYGTPEGFFLCDGCERLMVENYTWERYSHVDEGGEICLNCYAARVVADDSRWIRLTKKRIEALTMAEVHRAPHCLAVQGPIPKGLEFYKNVEVDSSTGGRLLGFSSAEEGPEGALGELREHLHELRRRGIKRAILILDGAYQFSVSLGVYIPKRKGERNEQR